MAAVPIGELGRTGISKGLGEPHSPPAPVPTHPWGLTRKQRWGCTSTLSSVYAWNEQREHHHPQPTQPMGTAAPTHQPRGTLGVWWVPQHPKPRTLYLVLLTGRGVRDVVARCSLSRHLPPAQGGAGVQGAAGAQHHRHLVLAAGAVVVEAHRGPQLGAICEALGQRGWGEDDTPRTGVPPPHGHSQAAGWSRKGQCLLRALSWCR